jgi:hypothetical protein
MRKNHTHLYFDVKKSAKHNIPVHVGEYGTYSAADLDSRIR